MSDTYHPEYIGTVYEEHFAEPNPFHVGRLWWPVADDPGYVHTVLYRSEDATKWEVSYGPPQEQGYEEGYFSSAD